MYYQQPPMLYKFHFMIKMKFIII